MVADLFVSTSESIVGTCPVCGKKTLDVVFREEKIPHFGRVVLSTSFCRSCGFRHTDVYEMEERKPARFVLRVDSPEKLNYYVIRSSTGRIEIVEIGMELSPGPYSQGFITTVEGILDRFLGVLPLFREYGNVQHIEDFLKKAMEGKQPFTLVVEDPRGLSRIVGKDVEIREYGDESSQQRDGRIP